MTWWQITRIRRYRQTMKKIRNFTWQASIVLAKTRSLNPHLLRIQFSRKISYRLSFQTGFRHPLADLYPRRFYTLAFAAPLHRVAEIPTHYGRLPIGR